VSVGHVARLVESAGIPTVAVYIEAFVHYARAMRLPRTLVVGHPMGRPIGPPGDANRQIEVVRAALDLVDTETSGGTVRSMPGSYRPSGSSQ
jgi:hypothetical protein